MKVALIETIEALVTAIKNKFLTKTEAESTYQPKDTAITTSNISNQKVSQAFSSDALNCYYMNYCNVRDYDTIAFHYVEEDASNRPPSIGTLLHMGGDSNHHYSCQAAFCENGELYIRNDKKDGSGWTEWHRMAKASEIPNVSGYATEDWVTSNYYNLQEMDENYYNAGDIDDLLTGYLPKSGGTMTGSLTLSGSNSNIILGGAIYSQAWNRPILQHWIRGTGKKNVGLGGSGIDYISFSTWAEVTSKYLYMNGYIHATEYMRINDIILKYDPSNNTLNLSGVSGQTVHLAVNGKVLA